MSLTEDKGIQLSGQACKAHDYDLMKPVVLASWKHGFQGSWSDKSAVLAESQVNLHFFNGSNFTSHIKYYNFLIYKIIAIRLYKRAFKFREQG